MTTPTQPLLPTPEPDSLEDWAMKSLSCLYIAVEASIADDVNQRVKAYINQLKREKRELASRPAPPAPEREFGEIAELHTGNLVKRVFSFGADTKEDFVNELKSEFVEALTAATEPLREQIEYVLRQRDMMSAILTDGISFTDEQLKEAGLGVGVNIEIKHELHKLRSQVAKLTKERDDANQNLAAIHQGIRNEFTQGELSDVVSDFGHFLEHHNEIEKQVAKLKGDVEYLTKENKQSGLDEGEV